MIKMLRMPDLLDRICKHMICRITKEDRHYIQQVPATFFGHFWDDSLGLGGVNGCAFDL
jgi:hypothetical protein